MNQDDLLGRIVSVLENDLRIQAATWSQHLEHEPWPSTRRLGGFLALETAIDNHQH